ncbi:MAG: nucleotidyltransferase family protein [Gammaproteobacteria bacterium]|nr:nucleotidyltransferase family protein [Gammaproteobacteria bacterium]
MRAMILAAGRGERMRPLTDNTPKPLLEVGGKALIEYHLAALQQADVHDVIINHAWLGEQIESRLGNGDQYGLRIEYSPEIPAALETAGGIIQALPRLGTEPFIVINGDIWCDYPLQQLPRHLNGLAHLVMVANPPHNPQGDFCLSNSKLQAAGEPKLTFSGIGVYHPELFAGLEPGIRPLAPLLKNAMAAGRVSGEYYQGRWYDIGTPERLTELDLQLEMQG